MSYTLECDCLGRHKLHGYLRTYFVYSCCCSSQGMLVILESIATSVDSLSSGQQATVN